MKNIQIGVVRLNVHEIGKDKLNYCILKILVDIKKYCAIIVQCQIKGVMIWQR
jgi:hypothetical protein